MQIEIVDKQKRSYMVKTPDQDPEPTRLNIFHMAWFGRQRFVGYVNLVWKSHDVLEFSDIIIEPHYRNRGVGTAVLQYVFALAQSRGVAIIEGRIGGRDFRVTPHLAEWYRRHGFALEEIGPDHPLNTKSHPLSVVQKRRRAQQDPAQQRDDQTIYLITKSLAPDHGEA